MTALRVLAVVAAALGASSFVGEAAACTRPASIGPVDARALVAGADAAFVGTLVDVRPLEPAFRSDAPHRFTYVVEEKLKGELPDRLELVSSLDGGTCGLRGDVGRRVGMLVDGRAGSWTPHGSGEYEIALLRRGVARRPVGELRDCRTRGEGSAPARVPSPRGVRLGPAVFWPSMLERQRGRPTPAGWFVVKAPLVVRARARVVLAIARGALGRATFQHGGGFTSAIRFHACSERVRAWSYRGTVGRLTFFPFAIAITARAACVPVELWIDGREQPLRRLLPVGRRSCG